MRFRRPPSPAEAPATVIEARDVLPTEVREPKAAVANLRFVTPGRETMPDWDAARAIALAYYSNVYVFRCVKARAVSGLSTLPFRVGADPAKPQDFRTEHPLARLLGPAPGGPNPDTSARRLWAWSMAQRDVTGRMGWELEQGANARPVSFWPLPGASLWPIPSAPLPGQTSNRYFDGFKYGPPHKLRLLKPEQVYYDWIPSQNDWRQPESVLQAARLDVSIAVMQSRYDYAFLRNDARPASVVVHQAFAEREEREAWREHFLAEHEGPDQAGKVRFVEVDVDEGEPVSGMIDIKTLGLSQRDAEFVKRYEATIRAITVAFGTPLSILGDASGRTFSNADAEERFFWRVTMLPEINDIADAVNIRLAPLFGSEVGWFDTSGVDALKVKRFANVDPILAEAAGIVSKDEIRGEVGLAPLPENEGTEVVPAPAKPPPVAPAPPAAAARPPALRAAPEAVDHAERRGAIYRSVSRQVKSLERVWERQWRSMFRRQRDATLRRLEGKRGRVAAVRASAGDVFDSDFWEAETVDFSTGLYEAIFEVGGARVADLFGLDFTMDAPYVERAIKARANLLAGNVTGTTYEAIKAQLAQGAAAGESIPALAKRIRHVFEVANQSRATTIARTEVISGYNQSSTLVARELGSDIVGGREWISTLDQRTRPDHAEADGQVVGLDEKFIVGGEEYDYPSDINCRCTTGLLTPKEMSERSRPPRRIGLRAAERHLALVQLGRAKPEEVAV